jgi:hypothetical protein
MNELQEQYRLLEVPADVSLATLKQAYKDLVLVWHPDRFSDHPRLQKKAEEKLKCINLAYQELSALYRQDKTQGTSEPSQTQTAPNSTSQYRYQNSTRTSRAHHRQTRSAHQSHSRAGSTKPSDVGITYNEAHFILSHFHFRAVQRLHCDRKLFKSGPFNLEIDHQAHQVILENLCDSINGFHPILLTIPCKASGFFNGDEARDLITLFQESQGRPD